MPEGKPIAAAIVTLGDLFSHRYYFQLPPFQRAYAWDITLVTRLLTDLVEAGQKAIGARRMFLGRILLARASGTTITSVIDGHQRIVTLSLLFAVIRDLASSPETRSRMRERLISDPGRTATSEPQGAQAFRLRPHLGLADFLDQYVQSEGATRRRFAGDFEGLSETEANVIANRDYLRSQLEHLDAGSLDDLATMLCEQCRVLVLEVEDEEEAWGMLQVEEQTRLDFSEADRAKTSILSAVPRSERVDCGEIWSRWQDALGGTGMRSLLGHVRLLELRKRSDVPVETELVRAFRLHESALEFFHSKLDPLAQDFQAISTGERWAGGSSSAAAARIQMARWADEESWVPCLLLWLRKRGAIDASTGRFTELLERLAWLFRLAGIDPLVQQNRYLRIMAALDKGSGPDQIPELSIEDRLVKDAVLNLRSRTLCMKHYCNPLLRRLSVSAGASVAEFDSGGFTIEHVLPRNPGTKSQWWRTFGGREQIAEHVNRLGNLCLLSADENQGTGARDYIEKRSILAGSSFTLARQAAAIEEWTAEEITRRTEGLIATLFSGWQLAAPV